MGGHGDFEWNIPYKILEVWYGRVGAVEIRKQEGQNRDVEILFRGLKETRSRTVLYTACTKYLRR